VAAGEIRYKEIHLLVLIWQQAPQLHCLRINLFLRPFRSRLPHHLDSGSNNICGWDHFSTPSLAVDAGGVYALRQLAHVAPLSQSRQQVANLLRAVAALGHVFSPACWVGVMVPAPWALLGLGQGMPKKCD